MGPGRAQGELEVGFTALQTLASKVRRLALDHVKKELDGVHALTHKLAFLAVLKTTAEAGRNQMKADKARLEASRLKFEEEKKTAVAALLAEERACKKC